MSDTTFTTDAELKALARREVTDREVWHDGSTKGLQLHAFPTGGRVWKLYYRFEGRRRMMRLGTFPEVGLAKARAKADKLRPDDPDESPDPLVARQKRFDAPTLFDLAEVYAERHVATRRTADIIESRIRRFLLGGRSIDPDDKPIPADPAGLDWSRRKLTSITAADVAELHHRVGMGHGGAAPRAYEANKVRRLLSSMFNKARVWGYIAADVANPAVDIEEFQESPRDRWLDIAEMKALIRALDAYTGWPETVSDRIVATLEQYGTLNAADLAAKVDHPPRKVLQLLSHLARHDPRVIRAGRGLYKHSGVDTPALPPKPEAHVARAAIWTILATGARKREVLGATWADIDLERGTLYLPAARSKTKKGETKALPGAVVELLRTIPKPEGCPYVFPSLPHRDGEDWAPLRDVRRPWQAIRAAAGLAVSIHDMRRTWASWAATAGESIYVVSKVLGHSSTRITEKVYAHVAMEPKRAAVERYTQAVRAAAYGQEGTSEEAVDLDGERRRRSRP